MLLSPEHEWRVQCHGVGQVRGPHVRKTDTVIPDLTLGNQRHTQDTIGQKQLDPLGHVGIETLQMYI